MICSNRGGIMCNFLYFSLSRKGDETMEVRGCWVSNMELSLSEVCLPTSKFCCGLVSCRIPWRS
jgi:hypothetical protein